MHTTLVALIVVAAGFTHAGAPQVGATAGLNADSVVNADSEVIAGSEMSANPELQPTLADLDWLVGSWHGEGLGGAIEEHWTGSAGGTMMGAFRLVVDGRPPVIEYMMITDEEERIAYRFKHFNSDYTTWEEDRPLEFTLISVAEREAVFHSDVADQDSPRRLTYRLTSEGDLVVFVADSDDRGTLTDSFEIRLSRR